MPHKNPEDRKAYQRARNPKRNAGLRERYREDAEFRAKLLADAAAWRQEHPEEVAQGKQEWRNRPEVQAARRASDKKRRDTDVNYRLSLRIRLSLIARLKAGKSKSALQHLGCTIDELRLHLESQFKPGMTWANWGRGEGKWHIDHRTALMSVDLSDPVALAKVCHYTNLQPLWEKENLSKGMK
jgi:hypothetical protein